MKKTKIKNTLAMVLLLCGFSGVSEAVPGVTGRTRDQPTIAAINEMENQIKDVFEAIREQTPEDKNLEEICFRLGILYQVSRNELPKLTQAADQSNTRMFVINITSIARRLPGFCGDKEKIEKELSSVQIAKGDREGLKRELTILETLAKGFLESIGRSTLASGGE